MLAALILRAFQIVFLRHRDPRFPGRLWTFQGVAMRLIRSPAAGSAPGAHIP
jgi:hypothetical protein